MAEQTKKTKYLQSNISDRSNLVIKLRDELEQVKKEIEKQNNYYTTMKSKLAHADLPQVLDYVNQKAEEYETEIELKNWNRKVEIAQLSAKQAQIYLKTQNLHNTM